MRLPHLVSSLWVGTAIACSSVSPLAVNALGIGRDPALTPVPLLARRDGDGRGGRGRILFEDDDDPVIITTPTKTTKTTTDDDDNKTTFTPQPPPIIRLPVTSDPPPVTLPPPPPPPPPPPTTTTTTSQPQLPPQSPTPTTKKETKSPSPTPSQDTRILINGADDSALKLPITSSADIIKSFEFSILNLEPSQSLTLHWTVKKDILHALLAFNATQYWLNQQPSVRPSDISQAVWGTWIGFGFGPDMLTSDLMTAYADPLKQQVKVIEYQPTTKYAPPKESQHKIVELDDLVQTVLSNTIILEFKRPIHPDSDLHWHIDVDEPFDVLWSLNPKPSDGTEHHLPWHGPKNRGKQTVTFLTGKHTPDTHDIVRDKIIHGIGMAIVFGGIMPLAIFVARYLKSVHGWMRIHIALQTLSTLLTFVFAVYIIVHLRPRNTHSAPENERHDTRAHPLLGFILFPIVILQALVGTFNRLGLSKEWIRRQRWVISLHEIGGKVILLVGFIQAGMGLDILYPWEDLEERGRGAWIAYGVIVGIWLGVFVWMEGWEWWKRRREGGTNKIGTIKAWYKPGKSTKISPPPTTTKVPNETGLTPITTRRLSLTPSSPTDLQNLSWSDISKATEEGKLWVVANNRWVYDISKWMTSHPGGQIILYSVAGTDVTEDFFEGAGCDASEFIQQQQEQHQQQQKSDTTPRDENLPPKDKLRPTSTSEPKSHHSPHSNSENPLTFPTRQSFRASTTPPPTYGTLSFTTPEWNLILKSRRTHTHTRSAIQRLSTLLIGSLSPSLSNSGPCPSQWVPEEYKRYALVSNTPLPSTPLLHKLKFSLLYPHRYPPPTLPPILPGQTMTLLIRHKGEIHKRQYVPISGDVSSFEIIVSASQNRDSTPSIGSLLTKSRVGDRQHKFLGPTNTPLFNLPPNPTLEKTLLITTELGTLVTIQTLKKFFLDTNTELDVYLPYTAQNSDELSLDPGDVVRVREQGLDGWAEGVLISRPFPSEKNDALQSSGFFPLGITYPPIGGLAVLTLMIVAETMEHIIGQDIIDAVRLAYPSQLRVVYVLAGGGGTNKSDTPGVVVLDGGVDGERVRFVVEDVAGFGGGNEGENEKIVVVGPEEFEECVEGLVKEMGMGGIVGRGWSGGVFR